MHISPAAKHFTQRQLPPPLDRGAACGGMWTVAQHASGHSPLAPGGHAIKQAAGDEAPHSSGQQSCRRSRGVTRRWQAQQVTNRYALRRRRLRGQGRLRRRALRQHGARRLAPQVCGAAPAHPVGPRAAALHGGAGDGRPEVHPGFRDRGSMKCAELHRRILSRHAPLRHMVAQVTAVQASFEFRAVPFCQPLNEPASCGREIRVCDGSMGGWQATTPPCTGLIAAAPHAPLSNPKSCCHWPAMMRRAGRST